VSAAPISLRGAERNAMLRHLRFVCLGKLDGWKKACALLLLGATTGIGSSAQTLTTLSSFSWGHGAVPEAGLVQATNGDFYGTANEGGSRKCLYGCGTVFKITPGGKLILLHTFCSLSGCTDGAYPYAGLVQAANGNLYGTASEGGAKGYGTVFKITPSGEFTTLYIFCSLPGCADGAYPLAGLVQAANGDLYGTTGGTVFKITPSGMLSTLHNFCSPSSCPGVSGLVQDTNGDLYGTTQGDEVDKDGTVFRITPSGRLTTLYSFCTQSGCTDGASPDAALAQGAKGELYGTTDAGGAGNDGTVFKITASGTLTTLYTFCSEGGCPPYIGIYSTLVQATDGNLYGTDFAGGPDGFGTIFKITPNGTLTTIYNFCSQNACSDGDAPLAGLIQATDGNLYGTTDVGGAHNLGTVFRLSLGLDPLVKTQTASGKVGDAVKILGTDLTSATGVKFNGTSALFTVLSSSLITTTVPTGATTGFVTVTTPSITLKSNKEFIVTHFGG
jgi:uncharacterized repeat protein (TIGR03803 family)